jgi:predicted lipoprotein with Yx(FWY)xxD motif
MKQRVSLLLIFSALTFLAACGQDTGAGSGSYNQSTPTNTPTTTSSSSFTVGVASVTVNGATKQALTNNKGLTLYYFTSDTSTTPACTGGCLNIWPAVISSTSTVSVNGTLPGTLTVLNDPSRQQVLYNGHLLYTYAQDQKPGDTTGEGVAGKWFVATTDLPAMAGTTGGY